MKDDTDDVLTYTGADANTVVVFAEGEDYEVNGLQSINDPIVDSNTGNREVTVYNEAGTADATYYIVLNWIKSSADATLASVTVDGTDVTIPTGRNDVDDNGRVFLGQTDSFTMVVTANNSAATVAIGSGDTLANAENNLEVRNSVTVTDSTARNGGFVLIKVTAENGDVMYYVYDTSVEQ